MILGRTILTWNFRIEVAWQEARFGRSYSSVWGGEGGVCRAKTPSASTTQTYLISGQLGLLVSR